jgi:hypothetical protein
MIAAIPRVRQGQQGEEQEHQYNLRRSRLCQPDLKPRVDQASECAVECGHPAIVRVVEAAERGTGAFILHFSIRACASLTYHLK